MTSEIAVRKLAQRSNDGIDVALLWSPRTNRIFIDVEDKQHGDRFRTDVSPADALDAFNHPYAYRKEPASCQLGSRT